MPYELPSTRVCLPISPVPTLIFWISFMAIVLEVKSKDRDDIMTCILQLIVMYNAQGFTFLSSVLILSPSASPSQPLGHLHTYYSGFPLSQGWTSHLGDWQEGHYHPRVLRVHSPHQVHHNLTSQNTSSPSSTRSPWIQPWSHESPPPSKLNLRIALEST